MGGSFYLSVQPYVAADNPNISVSNPIDLIWTKGKSLIGLARPGCLWNPPLTTDVEAGTVQYSDPFPGAWRRTFRVCETASVAVPVPGMGQTQSINLNSTQTTSLPTATVNPLLSAVRNPKINGADLFTASTVNRAAVTLSWDPPAIGTPFGYQVAIMSATTLLGTVSYLPTTTLSTAKTSITIPHNFLMSWHNYLFVITSLADGRANMETRPHGSSLPTASADVISAPITVTAP